MADISAIKPNGAGGASYNFKDATARSNIDTLSNNVSALGGRVTSAESKANQLPQIFCLVGYGDWGDTDIAYVDWDDGSFKYQESGNVYSPLEGRHITEFYPNFDYDMGDPGDLVMIGHDEIRWDDDTGLPTGTKWFSDASYLYANEAPSLAAGVGFPPHWRTDVINPPKVGDIVVKSRMVLSSIMEGTGKYFRDVYDFYRIAGIFETTETWTDEDHPSISFPIKKRFAMLYIVNGG